MQKIIALIEQVRFAELNKISRLSKTQERGLNDVDHCNQESAN
jgi:hypothetical protein